MQQLQQETTRQELIKQHSNHCLNGKGSYFHSRTNSAGVAEITIKKNK